MNCNSCSLMFNSKRKKVQFQCGYGFCQQCLSQEFDEISDDCPLEHQGCRQVKVESTNYQNNKFDKKLKIVFVGNQGVGKTTLIRSMQDNKQNQDKKIKPKKTYSIDLVTVVRNVRNLSIQFNLWDTASQSSILEQGENLTFKNSDVQIIVFKDGQDLKKVKYLFDFVEEKSQRMHVIIVENKTKESVRRSQEELSVLLKGKLFQYVNINCESVEEVNSLWSIIDKDCITLKPSDSKLKGSVISNLQSSIPQSSRRSCPC